MNFWLLVFLRVTQGMFAGIDAVLVSSVTVRVCFSSAAGARSSFIHAFSTARPPGQADFQTLVRGSSVRAYVQDYGDPVNRQGGRICAVKAVLRKSLGVFCLRNKTS